MTEGSQNTPLQIAIYRLSILHSSPNLNKGEKELVKEWVAELREMEKLPAPVTHLRGDQKPFMCYGIMCPDGTAYLDEICVDSNDSQTLVDVIEEQELEGHKVVPLYIHPAQLEHLRVACDGLSDDYMTSETHHPGWVLIPQEKFDAICAALATTEGFGPRRVFVPEWVICAPPAPHTNVTGWALTDARGRVSNFTDSVTDAQVWKELGYAVKEYVEAPSPQTGERG